jgi:hypothetical protein
MIFTPFSGPVLWTGKEKIYRVVIDGGDVKIEI